MTSLVGPVYIAHPYSALTAEVRRANVARAATLSSFVNSLGIATISPLQESHGRESVLSEDEWLEHGLVLLRACRAIVAPRHYDESHGCSLEVAEAKRIRIPLFVADSVRVDGSSSWDVDARIMDWISWEREQNKRLGLP